LLKTDGFNNFAVFKLDEFIVGITVTVELGQNFESLLFSLSGNQPSRRFGKSEDKDNLNEREETLKNGRDSPTPFVGDIESTKGSPSGNDRSEVP
jgi:hypothetical protein